MAVSSNPAVRTATCCVLYRAYLVQVCQVRLCSQKPEFPKLLFYLSQFQFINDCLSVWNGICKWQGKLKQVDVYMACWKSKRQNPTTIKLKEWVLRVAYWQIKGQVVHRCPLDSCVCYATWHIHSCSYTVCVQHSICGHTHTIPGHTHTMSGHTHTMPGHMYPHKGVH